ncbi:MAG: hypothetical protein J2P19_25775 [Pseudonocardia sp.]|nr:hypothetical protein [Pseudonocardia sp.]
MGSGRGSGTSTGRRRFVADALSPRPYRWRARPLFEAPAEAVAGLVAPTVADVEAVDVGRCPLVTGADSLDAIALHAALLDLPFTPLEPPELVERCAALAERLGAAAGNRP